MTVKLHLLAAAGLAALMSAPAHAQSTAAIIDEGMNRSQVMLTAHELIDGIGARLTNSPSMRRAEDWALRKFASYGLRNPRREGFAFGRGWEIVSANATQLGPRPIPLSMIPVAWTPGTNGTVRAQVVVAPISKVEHFDAYRGKLAGKIVMISLPGEGSEPTKPGFVRLDSAAIKEHDEFDAPDFDPEAVARRPFRAAFPLKLDAFLKAEGAVAWARVSRRDGQLLHGEGYTYAVGKTPSLPGIELSAEDYRRIARFAKTGTAPTLEINSNVRFVDGDTNGYNIIADLPGTDPNAGYVMAGAHMDSWVAADGAVDNGAGTSVVIEAARILSKLGVRPKRTIRFALWSGEEQGLIGSLGYIEKHLASRPMVAGAPVDENYARWANSYPITRRAGYGDLKAYFNMDNGSGKFRGIYAENNHGAVPLLKSWLEPFNSMGASAVVAGKTGGTDHVYLQAIGAPGFQFIQDPLDYGYRLHHSSADTLDHMKPADMRQAAVVMAGVLLAAANSDKEIPRPPLPTQPTATDPFKYDYPADRM